jgi:hypothetical protein
VKTTYAQDKNPIQKHSCKTGAVMDMANQILQMSAHL